MNKKFLSVFFILFVGKETISQPGSYTFCFGFVLYDSSKIVTDTSRFKLYWENNVTRDNWPCSETNYQEKFIKSFRLHYAGAEQKYVLRISNIKGDTMKLTYYHQWGMDQFCFLKKLPFQKGSYVLTQKMLANDSIAEFSFVERKKRYNRKPSC